MSAAEHADNHDEEEVLHQAPWVYFATYGTCLAFLALVMFAKGSYFASAAILWLTIISMPAQVYLAEKNWLFLSGSLGVGAGGYFALQMLLGG